MTSLANKASQAETTKPNLPIRTTPIRYNVGSQTFESQLVAPELGTPRAGLIFGPDWYGIYEYPLSEARKLAQQGFSVLVADLYGLGRRPSTDSEADQMSSALRADRTAVRDRMTSALQAFRDHLPAATRIAAFGFSFGGMAVLELVRTGADVAGVAVLSGILDSPEPLFGAAAIRAPVLIVHGTKDPICGMDVVDAFIGNMDRASKSYRVLLFGGARHAFTNPALSSTSDGPLRYSPDDAPAATAAVSAFLWETTN